MGKVDLKSAYRSVPIHPSNYAGTGLKRKFKGNKMKFTYFVDTKLPFGGGDRRKSLTDSLKQ